MGRIGDGLALAGLVFASGASAHHGIARLDRWLGTTRWD
jgi:hypothetical protein